MKENSIEIKDVLAFNERILTATGIWPLCEERVKITITIIYSSLHMIMLYGNLYDSLGNLELLIDNLIDNLLISVSYIAIFILRYNKSLARAIPKVKNDMLNGEFENVEELRIYYNYNNISRIVSKFVTCGGGLIAFLVYVGPMTQFIQLYKDHGNISSPLILPYRAKTFCDLSDYRIFIMFYIYQIFIPYVGIYHPSITCLAVILVLHICGRISILTHRIKNIPWESKEQTDSTIAEIVKGHLNIMRVEQDIQDAFSMFLLLDVGECMLRLAIVMYLLMVSTNASNITHICTFLPYVLVMLSLLYLYCWTGEQLVHACSNLQDAYYYCNWQDMSSKSKKSLIICMIHAQRTLQLTAGGFYTFSLYGYTSIIKSCMAYVSMFRTMSTPDELAK